MSIHESCPETAAVRTPDVFGCVVHRSPRDAVWLRLRGELDLAAAPCFGAHLDEALSSARLILVDLRDLTFMDSAGLATILDAHDRGRRRRRRVVILRGPAQVSRLIASTESGRRLEITDLRPVTIARGALRGDARPARGGGPAVPAQAIDPHAPVTATGIGPDPAPAAPLGTPGHLRRSELRELWPRRQAAQVREELVLRFLPLARRLAARYRSPNEPLEDLVQVATVGLLGAIDRFDPDRGTPFARFAAPTILGELRRHFRDTGWAAHVPRGAQELALRVDWATRELTAQTGRPPRVQALAAHLGIGLEDVLCGLQAAAARYCTALDSPVPGAEPGERQTLADTLGTDDERFGLTETALSLRAAIPRLPHRERRALTLRITQDSRQSDIAVQMGCSQMQVSRLLRRADVTLRDVTNPSVSNLEDPT